VPFDVESKPRDLGTVIVTDGVPKLSVTVASPEDPYEGEFPDLSSAANSLGVVVCRTNGGSEGLRLRPTVPPGNVGLTRVSAVALAGFTRVSFVLLVE
jgi:hypothetical protein